VTDSITPTAMVWSMLIACWLATVIMLGGTGFPAAAVQMYFTASSLGIIVFSLWQLRHGFPSGMATFGAVLATLSFASLLIQLVPIPYDIWKTFPGRDVMVGAFAAIGEFPKSLPLTLSPRLTQQAALSLLPPLAAFLAALTIPRQMFWSLSASIVACALAGFLIGIIQKSQGAASGLFFYNNPGTAKYATGTFANRNFFAAQLYASVPFLAALAMVVAYRWRLRPLVTSLFTLIYIGTLVAVMGAIGSRAGIILAMLSVLLTLIFIFRPAQHGGGQIGLGKGMVATLIFFAVMAQVSMVGVLRIAQTDPIGDFRNTISAVSFEAAKAQFPFGSGYGTFVPVYQFYETAETIVNPYINHAHNEWLELAIEGGATALALGVVFVLWLAYALIKAMRLDPYNQANAHIRAAGLALVLLLLHAIVDFPFRTDALLTMFGLCAGLLALATANSGKARRRASSSASRQTVPEMPLERRVLPSEKRHFAPRQPAGSQAQSAGKPNET
jgi:O-antigen ligase